MMHGRMDRVTPVCPPNFVCKGIKNALTEKRLIVAPLKKMSFMAHKTLQEKRGNEVAFSFYFSSVNASLQDKYKIHMESGKV